MLGIAHNMFTVINAYKYMYIPTYKFVMCVLAIFKTTKNYKTRLTAEKTSGRVCSAKEIGPRAFWGAQKDMNRYKTLLLLSLPLYCYL